MDAEERRGTGGAMNSGKPRDIVAPD